MTMLGAFELNQIYTGDARELAQGIPDESVDLVLTDPPFGIDFKYSNGYDDDPNRYLDLLRWIIAESNRIIKPGGLCFVFQAMPRLRETWLLFPENSRLFAACKNFTQYRPTTVQYGFDPVVFWQKTGDSLVNSMAGKRDWHIGNTALYITQDIDHSCPRPLNTLIYMIENFCPANGIVCDFFAGSGMSSKAAKMLGRNYLAFEIDPDTAERARQRVAQTQPPLFVLQPSQAEMELTA